MAVGWRDKYVLIIFQFFLNITWIAKHSLFNSVPFHEMDLQKMTKELALRPQYAQYPNPNPKPELFGQTWPKVKKPYSSWPAHRIFNYFSLAPILLQSVEPHYNCSVHPPHCRLLGAQRNGHLSSCGQLWKHCSTWPSVASAASARINTSDQPTTNLRPTATKRWPQPTIYHNLLVLYINTFTNTSKNHTPDSYKNIKLGMIWRISWTDDESHLPIDFSRISCLDEHARQFLSDPSLIIGYACH